MPLIQCPECKKDVSNLADKCIHCGYPLTVGTIFAQPASVQTIERTGKKWKLQQLAAGGVTVVGALLMALAFFGESDPISTARFRFGIVFLVIALIWGWSCPSTDMVAPRVGSSLKLTSPVSDNEGIG
jgi:hypothetical protein